MFDVTVVRHRNERLSKTKNNMQTENGSQKCVFLSSPANSCQI